MAVYYDGVSGPIKGKLGNVFGATWKGIEYLRTRPIATKRQPSPAQLEHRAKFTLVTKFVHCIGKLLMSCYPDTPELTAINNAFANIYAKAIIGTYPAFDLDYSKILISRGELHNCRSWQFQ